MRRKLTHEEFITRLHQINANIEVLGTYVNSKTKIKCKCKVCGHEWESTPSRLLNGHGCPKCVRKRISQNQTKTHEEFINRLHQINPDIEVLGTYKNNNTKILCKCKIDGYEWEGRPADLLRGHGCTKCGNKRSSQKRTMAYEEFMKKFYKQNEHAQDIELLETYTKTQNKIKCKCKQCGYEWSPITHSLLMGQGCPKCAGKLKLTHEEFMEKLYKQNKHAQDIEILGTYINCATKILCRCKIDGHEWSPRPNGLLRGQGCPKCSGRIKTHKEFITELQQVNPDIEVIGKYMTTNTKLKVKCKRCGHIWEAAPNNLLSGWGCPKCNISRGEKRITQYLDNLGIDYIYNTCYFNDLVGTGGGILRPDFIIPSLKIWIEYDGIQHYEPINFRGAMNEQQLQERFEYTQQNDQIKNQYAKDNNWTLIRIPYTEYDNIEQILDAYLKQEQAV